MFKNILWMGFSAASRAGASIITFVLIARALGPQEFGHYMFWYGTTYLCTLLSNYGLGNLLLKEIAQRPENVANLLGEALSLRIALSAGILVCALAVMMLTDRPELLFIFLLAHSIEFFADIFFVAYRAMGHYSREAQLATYVAISQLVLIALTAAVYPITYVIAFAFMSGKIVQLFLILRVSKNVLGSITLPSASATLKLAIRAKAYAVDTILGSSFGHIDNIVLRACVGIDAVGIYQAGMRIFQGGIQVAPILANVFLPEMARHSLDTHKKKSVAFILQMAFLFFGITFGLVLAYFPKQIVDLTFGKNFSSLITLLPLFGLLFFIRFFAASWGVILTAEGQQGYRAKLTVMYIAFMLIVGAYLAYDLQSLGWLATSIFANLLLGVLQMIRVSRAGMGKAVVISAGTVVFGILLFVPSLLWR